jgi:hypothetical protein
MRAQRGQSMVEFAVVATVLAALPLGMVMLARYHDLQLRAIQGARYAVFDSLWWGSRRSAADAQEGLRERLFDDPFWKDPWGEADLVDARRDVSLQAQNLTPPGRAVAVIRFILQPLSAASGFLGSRFDIAQNGFHTAQVRVSVHDSTRLPAPLDRLGLELEERAAILGDAWNASGPAHVARRISGLMPTSLAGEARSLLDPVNAAISLVEPAFRHLCWGYVDTEIVPSDRLAPPPASSRATPGAGAC